MPAPDTIALVDDDPSSRRALQRLLGSAGYAVRPFASAEELLDSGFARCASCLLVDVHMAGMSGFELIQALRAGGVRSAVVFMTANDSEHTRELAAELGSGQYLRKPFDTRNLIDSIRAAIETDSTPPGGRKGCARER